MPTVYKVHKNFCRQALSLKKGLKSSKRGNIVLYLTSRKQRIEWGSEEPLGVRLVGACFNVALNFKYNFF